MVRWDFKNKMGSYIDEYNNKITLYSGSNCLIVELYEFKDAETKEEKYQFVSFFNDLQHAKNCLGLARGYKDNLYKNTKKWRLNTYYKDTLKLAKLLTLSGLKVELYYKVIKK